jgi:hypothetical protein
LNLEGVIALNPLQQLLSYITAPFRFLLRVPTYLVTTPGKLLGLSLPARAALSLDFFFVLCILTVWAVQTLHPGQARVNLTMTLIVLLVVANIISLVFYYTLRMWLQGDVSRFPEIDEAWNAGMSALKENNIDIHEYPLYLILGLPDSELCTALFTASKIKMIVAGVPQGKTPLRWYASDEAIYLACPGMGCLGSLSESAGDVAPASEAKPTDTLVPGAVPANSHNPMKDTLVPGGAPAAQPDVSYRTLMPSDLTNQPGDVSHATPPSGRASQSVSQQQEYLERLDYVFQRLRQARQPYCANNGVLTIFPHSVFRDILFAKDLPNAIHQDLATLRHATQLSSPVTVLVTGMEAEPGFSELALRVGLDRARKSRIGKGFNVWNKATDENLDALASHACGAFEDHIYGMFKTDDGFDNPTNGNLYAMLCRLRRDLQPKIRRALVHGCSTKSENGDRLGGQLPILFGGCYFGSTGNLDEEQVFVRSVIDARLPELCEELQYSDEAHREDARYLGITRLLAVVNVGLFAVILYYAFQILKRFSGD